MTSPVREAVSLNEAAAAEVRSLLGRRQMRQSVLARRLGETEVWVSRRLRGIQTMSLSDIERIAQALDLEPVELLASAVRATRPTSLAKPAAPDRPRDNRPKGGPEPRRKISAVVPRRTRPLGAMTGDPPSRTAA